MSAPSLSQIQPTIAAALVTLAAFALRVRTRRT